MLYQKVNRYLSSGYAVIYGVESAGRTEDVIRNMANSGMEEVDGYIKSGALTVIDRNAIYSQQKTQFESEAQLGVWIGLVSDIKKRSKGQFRGIAAMGMPEPLFETRNHQKLVDYEQFVSKQKFDVGLEAICCYMQKSVKDLSLGQLISLLSSHQYIVADTFGYNEWHATNIIEWVNKGLEKMLGRATCNLAFEAIKHIYTIDEGVVISQPEILEKAIKKMFVDSADLIMDAIKDEIIKEISFTRNLSGPTDKPKGD